METSRRAFIGGLAALVAAPAIVRAGNIMVLRPTEKLLIPHNYLTINQITREAIRLFTESNPFLQSLHSQYEKQFVYSDDIKWGSEIRIRYPADYMATRIQSTHSSEYV